MRTKFEDRANISFADVRQEILADELEALVIEWHAFVDEGNELARAVTSGNSTPAQRVRFRKLMKGLKGAESSTDSVDKFMLQLASDVLSTMLGLCQVAKKAFRDGRRSTELVNRFFDAVGRLPLGVAVPDAKRETLRSTLEAMFVRHGDGGVTPYQTALTLTVELLKDKGISREMIRTARANEVSPSPVQVGRTGVVENVFDDPDIKQVVSRVVEANRVDLASSLFLQLLAAP